MSCSMSLEGGRRQSESSESTHSCHSINDILGLVKSIPAASPAEFHRSERPAAPEAEAMAMTTPAVGAKRSRKRRARTNYTTEQLDGLEKLFTVNRYPGIDERDTLSDDIKLSEARIQVWFQNRRARRRRGCIPDVDSTSSPKSSSPQTTPRRPNTKPATSSRPVSSPDSLPSTSDVSPSSSPPQYLKVCTQSCCVKPHYSSPHQMQSGTQYLPQSSYSYYPWAAYQAAGYPLFYHYPGASPYFYDPTLPVSSAGEAGLSSSSC